jgi:hypothetical protein
MAGATSVAMLPDRLMSCSWYADRRSSTFPRASLPGMLGLHGLRTLHALACAAVASRKTFCHAAAMTEDTNRPPTLVSPPTWGPPRV